MEDQKSRRLESLVLELEKRKQQHLEGGSRRRRLRRFFRGALMLIAVLFIALAAIFFVNFFRLNSDLIEGHIKQGIIPNLTQGRFILQVGAVSGNLLYGVELENVLVQNPAFAVGSTLLTVPRVSLKYSLFDILFGRLVLQNLVIDNPVLTIRRDGRGRGIWDFSSDSDQSQATSNVDNETVWQKRDKAQVVADRYLSDIRVNNLSILVPAPDTLIKDEFIARVIRLPGRTYQLDSINLSLRKYPAKDFKSHVLQISLPDRADWLRFQVTTLKGSGNFTINFDALGQNFNFAVENLGQKGRKINLYDGRHRERLNLEWVWARRPLNLPEKIRGLTGVIQIPQFNELVAGFLPPEYQLSGQLRASFECQPGKPLYDARAEMELASTTINLPFVPLIKDLSASISAADRRARLNNLSLSLAGISSSHRGQIDFSDAGDIKAQILSDLAGDRVAVAATYSRLLPGVHRFDSRIDRAAGMASFKMVRRIAGKEIVYSDFEFAAGLIASGSAADILPLNLLRAEARQAVASYFSRVDVLGPLKISSRFDNSADWRSSAIAVDLTGTRVVSRNNPSDSMIFSGKALLASGVLKLDGLSAAVNNLVVDATGSALLVASSPFLTDYQLQLHVAVRDSEFVITSDRLQASIGLKTRPDFDRIELAGKRIAALNLNSAAASSGEISFASLRFIRRGKPLWADNGKISFVTDVFGPSSPDRQAMITAHAGMDFFGIPIEASATVNLGSGTLDIFSCKGGGSNFARMLAAFQTQPEGRALLQKFPVDLSGSFNFALLGSGQLKTPQLEGWIRFPALNLGLPGLTARLPFNASLKTVDDGYQAVVKAGEALLKIKDVTFDLGKTAGEFLISQPFSGGGGKLTFRADSSVFGADFKASGSILPAERRIDAIRLSIASSRIETLAAEISRIGRFRLPFAISGAFSGLADLSGPFASPDSQGWVRTGKLDLDFPLSNGSAATMIPVRQFAGQLKFEKRSDRLFELDLQNLNGRILDAEVKINGKAHLENQNNGFKPVIDNLSAELNNLDIRRLYGFLSAGLLPESVTSRLRVNSGTMAGRFLMSGTARKIIASGSASLRDGSLGFAAFRDEVKKLTADFSFEGRTDSGYSRIGLRNLQAEFGRSQLKVAEGWLENPLKTGRLSCNGSFEKVFPADMLALMGGLKVPALSFPEEGSLSGSLELSGTLGGPLLKADVQSSAMTFEYDSGSARYKVPLGRNHVKLTVNAQNGLTELEKCQLELLGGSIEVRRGTGRFWPGLPFVVSLEGIAKEIDLGRLRADESEMLKGMLSGAFKADWSENGARDAVFNLEFKNIIMPGFPLLDPRTVNSAGADFLEKPDFRTGQLNFYVTTEEDEGFKGKLLIADGLFAGPHMRFEIGNSEFDPMAMQLTAKLMINPQSLRQSEIGRKLKKWTVTLQDEKTGIPYVDLTVSGSWAKPELISSSVKKKIERRARKNFIGRIFGGHRPHKASVEELMIWFPGWKKGL